MANRTGTSKNDKLTGTNTSDRLFGLAGNDLLIGLGGVDTLDGGAGNDTLDGGTGNDKLIGGAGNDTYIVTATSGTDVFVEAAGAAGGTDTVRSSRASFTLGTNLENLVLLAPAVTGIGNSLNNVITGNSLANTLSGMAGNDTLNGGTGNDSLNGGTGSDSMAGSAGNDTYVVDVAGDKVFESGSGIDTVQSTVTFSLAAHAQIENLTLMGTGAINGTGNSLANTITGNSLANTLSGLGGADKLSGGAGNDVLIWDALDTARDGGAGTDTLSVTANGAVNLASEPIANMEIVELAGTNTLTLTAAHILSGFTNDTMTVNGGAGDAVIAGSGWTQLANDGNYAVYEKDDATLKVDLDINRDGIEVEEVATVAGFSRFSGAGEYDYAGSALAAAGDVNGDGYGDIIIGARRNEGETGAAYVVFGSASGFGTNLDLTALDGTNGFRLQGEDTSDGAGWSVAAGDFDGDGLSDVIVGAISGGAGNSGAAYLVYGKEGAFASSIELGALDGTAGFRMTGAAPNSGAGFALASGDVNADGLADIVVGSLFASTVHVVFGSTSGMGANLDLSGLDGANGFRLTGGGNSAGSSLASGDVNGDGIDDIVTGATGASPGGAGSGAVFVLFGSTGTFGPEVETSALDGANGFMIAGAAGDYAGNSVATGDFDGDGISDVAVGAYRNNAGGADSGSVYIVFGVAEGFGGSVSVTALDGTNGIQFAGRAAGDLAGRSVAAVDLNLDGKDDLIVGASRSGANGVESGEVALIFSDAAAAGFIVNEGTTVQIGDGDTDILAGAAEGDQTGHALAPAGDVDGDGRFEILIGAPGADEGGFDVGAAWISALLDVVPAPTYPGTSGDDSAEGGTEAEIFVGGLGNDTFDGGGGADVFRGGFGDDAVWVATNQDFATVRADGGVGTDSVVFTGSGMSVDFGAINYIAGMERADISGDGANEVWLTPVAVAGISGTSNEFTILGDVDDIVHAGNGWTFAGEAEGYESYTHGHATLVVSSAIALDIGLITGAIALSELDGARGFALAGTAGTYTGNSVSSAGDVNGDGYEDIVIGAMLDGAGDAGAAYVVFGKASGYTSNLDLTSLNGSNGFKLSGAAANDKAGYSVSGAGDVNGDGYADLVVGAAYGGTGDLGAVYVVFGKAGGFAANVQFGTTAFGAADGFRIDGQGGLFAMSASSSGDVNGDGYADVLVGAPLRASGAGAAYLVFGQGSGLADLHVSELDGTSGFAITGGAGANAGFSVSNAGDLDRDGYDDLLIGARWEDIDTVNQVGAAYVIYGEASFAASVSVTSLDGAGGFKLSGVAEDDRTGYSVSLAGDVNGDGYADAVVGATHVGTIAGAAYVVFGSGSGFTSDFALSGLDGTNGFRLAGVSGDAAGNSVDSAGDVNGDGFDDLIVGAYGSSYSATGSNGLAAGTVYVVFGRAGGYASSFVMSALGGTDGFRLDGLSEYDLFGRSVSAGGDINGDGFDDLVVGAGGNDSYAGADSAYVVFGRDFTGAVTHQGTSGAEALSGSVAAEIFVAGGGNDTLRGGGGADVFRGGEGDDWIVISSDAFLDVDGGTGHDTLAVAGQLNLAAVGHSRIGGIEVVDLAGGEDANGLGMELRDLLALSDTSNELTVEGDASDVVAVFDGTWSLEEDVGGYDVYTLGAATLRVSTLIGIVDISILEAP